MRAFILAAGRGERMRPLTDTVPKPMLLAGGEPLIAHTVHNLVQAGITELVVNLAWLGDKIKAYLGTGHRFGASIRYSPEATALETAGGIINALPLLGDGPFIVVNGDIWTDFDFKTLLDRSLDGRSAHLVMVDNPEHHPQGDFVLEGDKLIESAAPRLTYSGIGLYSPKMFDRLAPGKRPLAPLLSKAISNSQLGGEYHAGQWWDIGSPERLHQLNRFLGS
jgi:MurNAc alpha-1-phosphate uridylyltransferase